MHIRSIVGGLAAAGLVAGGLTLAAPSAEAARPQVTFRNGKLAVFGTDGDDSVVITRTRKAVKVKVNGTKVRFRPALKPGKVKSISVTTRGGDDTVLLREKAGPLPQAKLNGGAGNDHLTGDAGSSRLIGQDGNDVLVAGSGPTSLEGGDGDDRLVAGAGSANVVAAGGNDVVLGGTGPATIAGGPGNDDITTGAGAATVDGGIGDDRVTGGAGSLVATGGDGRDNLAGGASASATLSGGNDDDTLIGGTGAATLSGDGGNDVLRVGLHTSQMAGGPGVDTFKVGEALSGSGTPEAFGGCTIADFETGEKVDLFTGLLVQAGDGTAVVTIGDGVTPYGTLTSGNNRPWSAAGDFI